MRLLPAGVKDDVRYEIWGVLVITLAGLVYVGMRSESGLLSGFLSKGMRVGLGEGAIALPVLLVVIGILLMVERRQLLDSGRFTGLWLSLLLLLTYLHLNLPEGLEFENAVRGLGGGIVGASISTVLLRVLGETGRLLVLISATVVALSLITGLSLRTLGIRASRLMFVGVRKVHQFVMGLIDFVSEEEQASEASGGVEASLGYQNPVDVKAQEEMANLPEETGPSADATGGSSETLRPEDYQHFDQLSLGSFIKYQLPPVSLLQRSSRSQRISKHKRDITEKAKRLEETLSNFGIAAKVVNWSYGPAVTRFELQLAPGVKVSRVMNLSNDVALSLAASNVRIEAPVPGKAVVGVEVPNDEPYVVMLRDVLETSAFADSTSKLTLALGVEIDGKPVVSSLDKLLHLLIGGATGSGKSVCLNSIICSILFKAYPNEVKFLMIDPKLVELKAYDGIPHLIMPVVTNPKEAAGCLKWAVKEMEYRYELFSRVGVREIDRFNDLVAQGKVDNFDQLPYIVIIIDELSELMMVAPLDVEDCIHRLAQMARAAGIHLVVATQRPSVDVITGVIKANIPSRIAFNVSSQVDSRTILDIAGAEKLVGKGDMLFMPIGASKPLRVQGCYVSESEVEELVRFLKEQGKPEYVSAVIEQTEDDNVKARRDELLVEAVRLVVETRQASTSLLQRKLRIGYSRAARLIDEMEEMGIVSKYDGSKPREVLITFEGFRRLFGGGPTGTSVHSRNR